MRKSPRMPWCKAAWTAATFCLYHAGTLHVPAIATASHRQEAAPAVQLHFQANSNWAHHIWCETKAVELDATLLTVLWTGMRNFTELSRHLTSGDMHRAEKLRPCWLSGLKTANGMTGIQMVRLWFSALVMFFWICTVHLISPESGQKLTVDAKCRRISYSYCLSLHITTNMPHLQHGNFLLSKN